MNTKTCVKCHSAKEFSEFPKRKDSKDGFSSWCKVCGNDYRRLKGCNLYETRKNEHIENQRKYRKTPAYQAYEESYRTSYKATFCGVVTDLLTRAKGRAKQKNMEFELDRKWVSDHLEAMKCEASGLPLVLATDPMVAHTAFKPSIDRIDNSKGYSRSNSRIVCVLYNKAKSDYTDADVLKLVNAMADKQKVDV